MIHRRIIKQIVQSKLILVGLRRTATGSAPKAVKVGEMISAALNIAFPRHLKVEAVSEKVIRVSSRNAAHLTQSLFLHDLPVEIA
jgi:hypothetical protein